MEPGHEDREYEEQVPPLFWPGPASMEPGHEDREYDGVPVSILGIVRPQWSPAMKTGNTGAAPWKSGSRRGLNGARP